MQSPSQSVRCVLLQSDWMCLSHVIPQRTPPVVFATRAFVCWYRCRCGAAWCCPLTSGSQIGHCETNRPLAVTSPASVAWPRHMDEKRCDSYQRCNDQHGVGIYRDSSDGSTATMCTDCTVPLPPQPSPPVRRPRRQASARSGRQSAHRIAAICMAGRREAFSTPREHAAPL